VAPIDREFTDYLRQRHTAPFTIAHYCRFLRQVAGFLARRGRCASKLCRRDVALVMRGCLPGWKVASRRTRRSGLHRWLKFIGRFDERPPRFRWQPWLDDYASFLRVDRALAPCTCEASLRVVGQYLAWQFQRRPLRWDRVRPEDLCRYAARQCRVLNPKSVNCTLSSLRQFLRFMHLRGACSPTLVHAVPCVADFGRQVRPEVLNEVQRRTGPYLVISRRDNRPVVVKRWAKSSLHELRGPQLFTRDLESEGKLTRFLSWQLDRQALIRLEP